MSVYDARLKHVHDNDIFYADGISLCTSTSWVSNIVDLGAPQAFVNNPVHVFWQFSANFSLASSVSLLTSGLSTWDKMGMRSWLELQDAADGSTFNSILLIPAFDPPSAVSSISIVNATNLNALNVGIGSIRRYSRLRMQAPTLATVTVKAWLRLGLTKA